MHLTHVFCYRDQPVRMTNSSVWKRIRGTVRLKHVRVHDFKHTIGRRPRAAGAPLETRKVACMSWDTTLIVKRYAACETRRLSVPVCFASGRTRGSPPA